jgi:hypothetical protein
MRNPTLNPEQLPGDPDANSCLRSSCSQMYRLTLRPKPGSDAIRNLRAALKALGRRYALDVVELRPVYSKPRQTRVAVAERQARHKATPRYSFFGKDIPRPPPEPG